MDGGWRQHVTPVRVSFNDQFDPTLMHSANPRRFLKICSPACGRVGGRRPGNRE
jgi:hypothetical protein